MYIQKYLTIYDLIVGKISEQNVTTGGKKEVPGILGGSVGEGGVAGCSTGGGEEGADRAGSWEGANRRSSLKEVLRIFKGTLALKIVFLYV